MKDRLARLAARYTYRKPVRVPTARPLVSFSFDDVPRSACTLGAEIVENAGGRSTYYVSGQFESREPYFYTSEDLIRLHASGHEIGSHSFGHLNLHTESNAALAADLEQNSNYLQSLGLPAPRTFAYPWGFVSPAGKRLCNGNFEAARSVRGGINRGMADLGLLNAVPLYARSLAVDQLEGLFADLGEHGGWLIFLTHAVTNDPDLYDTSPELLKRATQLSVAMNIPILPISKAVDLLTR